MGFIFASNLGQYGVYTDFCASGVGNTSSEVTLLAADYASKFWSNGNGKALMSTAYDRFARQTISPTVAAGQVIILHARCRHTMAANRPIIAVGEGATVHVAASVQTDGSIKFYRSIATALAVATAAGVVTSDVAYHLGLEIKVHDTAGYIKVWINGTLVLTSATNLDTRNGGTGIVSTIFLGGVGAGATDTGSDDVYITDLIILDDTGSELNAFLGNVRYVLNITPTAGASGYQFTPSASTNETNIDDPVGLHDGSLTYNQDNVAGHKDHFTFATWTGFTGTIKFVHEFGVCVTPDAGTHTARFFAKSGGTYDNGTAFSVPSSFGEFSRAVTKDPSTAAAWASFAAIAAAEFGYEMVS